MKEITIKSEVQANGLFGIPVACRSIKRIELFPVDKLLHSAIITGVSESYPMETFNIVFMGKRYVKKVGNIYQSVYYSQK